MAPASEAGLGGSDAKIACEGHNAEVNFHGEKRSNATHASVTDPDAHLSRKGEGQRHCGQSLPYAPMAMASDMPRSP